MIHARRAGAAVLAMAIPGLAAAVTSPPLAGDGLYQAPGTRRMAERLAEIARSADPMRDRFRSAERAELLRANLAGAGPGRRARLREAFAMDLLNAGRNEEAIQELDELEKLAQDAIEAETRSNLSFYRALAYLRVGEQENCLEGHTVESCLLPIRGPGVHKRQRGSRAAIGILTQILKRRPADYGARWLLNIAYMTVGAYPDSVPKEWLVPPSSFESDHDIGRFPDISGKVGLDLVGHAGGSIMEDFDGDGYLDLVVSRWGFDDQLRFLRNDADGTFTERTKEAGLVGEVGGLNVVQTDFNNDGHPDVFVLRGAWRGEVGLYPNSLLRNNGDGTFDDVTEEAGLLSFHPTQAATWLDYDGDGWLDVFIGNESGRGRAHPCELYRNNGDGTFTERAAAAGLAYVGFVKGVASGDFNDDGRPDLYLSVFRGRNVLYRNDGPAPAGGAPTGGWKFTDVTAQAGVAEPDASFATWFWDYDNDGREDIFVASYDARDIGAAAAASGADNLERATEFSRLYRNLGDGTFADVTRAAKLDRPLLVMGANYGDLDNDGFLDFYAGTGAPDLSTLVPNRMYRSAEARWFQDVTTSGGFGHLQKGHAVSFGDIDNDGDQDVYEVMGGAYSGDVYPNVLFENPGHGNHWLQVRLEGVKGNRAAIGARIKVVLDTPAGPRDIHRTVSSGGSFGASPLRQAIGLGRAKGIRSLEITWPVSGRVQVFRNVAMDRILSIREGQTEPSPLGLKALRLGGAGPAAHRHR